MMPTTAPVQAAPERWQHGSSAVTVNGRQRVRSGVTALRKAGRIGDAEVADADRWYRDYILGVCGVFDAEPGRGAGGGDAHTAGFARAKAAQACRLACAAVGRSGTDLLIRFVAEDASLISLETVLGMDRKSVVGAVVMTLRRLTEHYHDTSVTGLKAADVRSADFSS